MKLTEQEKHSSTWTRLEEYLRSELDILRQRNDAEIDATSTARLRGRILQIKQILSLAISEEKDEQ